MKTKLGIGLTAVGAAALLALAPSAAVAVAPETASATYDCGTWGGGTAQLAATQDGTTATITLTSSVTAPIAIGADTLSADLLLTLNGGSTQTHFTGTANPAMAAGDPIEVGPLTGTVASGDSLDSYLATGDAYSLQIVYLGIAVTCQATTVQDPGPFVF
jgi:hypothetical protein